MDIQKVDSLETEVDVNSLRVTISCLFTKAGGFVLSGWS